MDLDPDLRAPDPSWRRIPSPGRYGVGRSYVHGDPQGLRHRVVYYLRPADGALVARTWFGPDCEGPPGSAHGGAVAALLDEVTGGVPWMHGDPALATEFTVRFLRRVPLGQVLHAEGHAVERGEGQWRTRGHLATLAGEILGEAENSLRSIPLERIVPDVEQRRAAGDVLPWMPRPGDDG